jgi:hypothetical protein
VFLVSRDEEEEEQQINGRNNGRPEDEEEDAEEDYAAQAIVWRLLQTGPWWCGLKKWKWNEM